MRRPRRVYERGTEPDARFTLANERTLLAWLRTAIAFAGAGVAVVALSELVEPQWVVNAFAIVSFVGGGTTAFFGYLHWKQVEIAMREGRALPPPVVLIAVLGTIMAMMVIGVVALLGFGL